MFLFDTKKKINSPSLRLRVLVSPLEWGLGHATRCIPLISSLLSYHCEVFIAAEGATCALLKNEFPQVKFLPLRGYHVKISSTRWLFSLKIISQFPKIMYAILYEQLWLGRVINKFKINAVISDNRVGLHNKAVTSIYITHQLNIKTGNIFTSAVAQRIHRYYINKFDECWIPDFENNHLAGELSKPVPVPGNVRYIGALSRFEKEEYLQEKYDLLIILSGPEPQRTIFEEILLKDLLTYKGRTLMIRGLPGQTQTPAVKNMSAQIINHLPSKALGKAIQQAGIIISRSGYTTVMDLVKLSGKAILVPTPGQNEQEYLAGYLTEKKMFFSLSQEGFNLNQALEKFKLFEFTIPVVNMEQYKTVIEKFVQMNTPVPVS